MNEIAQEIAAVHLSKPPQEASLPEQFRHVLRSHITYIDSYGQSFVAFARGNLGSGPQQHAAFDELRWQGVQRALLMPGIAEPAPPVLRTALRGWVCYFDEMMIDRITHRDLGSDVLIELAIANLSATLQTVTRLDPSIAIAPAILDALNTSSPAELTPQKGRPLPRQATRRNPGGIRLNRIWRVTSKRLRIAADQSLSAVLC